MDLVTVLTNDSQFNVVWAVGVIAGCGWTAHIVFGILFDDANWKEREFGELERASEESEIKMRC